jgi:cell wall assembly regulator SMI1
MASYATEIEEIKSLLPVYRELLNPGASEEETEAFLKATGLEIPSSFIELYKACNGGMPYESIDIEGMTFFSLERVLRTKTMFDDIMKEKQREGKFFYWHSDWLPFFDDFSYDTLCIDTTGKGTGMKGCVLQRSKDLFEGEEMSVMAPDFDTFVRGWLKRIKEGEVYSLTETDEHGKNKWLSDNACYYEQVAQVPLNQGS